jgi:syntaxin-binding protein 5
MVSDLWAQSRSILTVLGDVIAYDLDRRVLSPFRIPNFWRERSPRSKILAVVTLALHPRDVGKLLIGYTEGAVTYSFKQNKPQLYLQYELPPGAPGGDSDPTAQRQARHPRLTQALWHPTGTFIMTGHEDSSLVFWDAKEGKVLMARTLTDTNVNVPGVGGHYAGSPGGNFTVKEPLFRVSWLSTANADETGLVISGGAPTTSPTKGLTFFDFGITPVYATSSWQILSNFFASPKRQRILPTPPGAEVIDFCLIPKSSPHYAGAHEPIAVIALLSSGELVTLAFPTGQPIEPANYLHPDLSFVHPFANRIDLAYVSRERWLGMTETRKSNKPWLTGGAEGVYPLKRFEKRSIVQTSHGDGTVRLWDAGHADEIENGMMLQVDVSRAVGRYDHIDIKMCTFAGAAGELAVGLRSGECILYRWDHNRNFGHEMGGQHFAPGSQGTIRQIQDRADPAVKEGLCPQWMLDEQQGAVTAVKVSDVGFVGVCYENGSVTIVDQRGPAVIFHAGISQLTKISRRGSIRGRAEAPRPDFGTCAEFGVMPLEGDGKLQYVDELGRHISFTLYSLTILRLCKHLFVHWYQIRKSCNFQDPP